MDARTGERARSAARGEREHIGRVEAGAERKCEAGGEAVSRTVGVLESLGNTAPSEGTARLSPPAKRS